MNEFDFRYSNWIALGVDDNRTLVEWYREGADVERQLPTLSTYLGHACVRDTYWYLSACPDLMQEAARRLEKIKGKKRHLLVDTQGLLMQAIVHSADVQDCDGGVLLLSTLLGRFPYLEKLFADSAYQGPIFADALAKILSRVKVEIVKRSDQAKGFVTLPKRWIVERRFRFEPNSANPIPAPFGATRILRTVIRERSASASASPSLGPGNGILRAETGRRFRPQNAGERPEFGSQTATCSAARF